MEASVNYGLKILVNINILISNTSYWCRPWRRHCFIITFFIQVGYMSQSIVEELDDIWKQLEQAMIDSDSDRFNELRIKYYELVNKNSPDDLENKINK